MYESVKLKHGNFEFFILNINAKTTISDIEPKLKSYHDLWDTKEKWKKPLAIEVSGKINQDLLHSLVVGINDLANSMNMHLYGIIANQHIEYPIIAGIPIISSNNNIQQINTETQFIDEPIRSGAKIQANSDIVITSFVSANAEVIASGSIHVYGNANGKLFAGANGNKHARIFASKFNPQLIAIAGIYKIFDNGIPNQFLNKNVMIFLDEKSRINITAK